MCEALYTHCDSVLTNGPKVRSGDTGQDGGCGAPRRLVSGSWGADSASSATMGVGQGIQCHGN